MGRGTAWGGHLFCTQEISGVRFPSDPPVDACSVIKAGLKDSQDYS